MAVKLGEIVGTFIGRLLGVAIMMKILSMLMTALLPGTYGFSWAATFTAFGFVSLAQCVKAIIEYYNERKENNE